MSSPTALILHRKERLKAEYPSLRENSINFCLSHNIPPDTARPYIDFPGSWAGFTKHPEGAFCYFVFHNNELLGRAVCRGSDKKKWEFITLAKSRAKYGLPRLIKTEMRGALLLKLKEATRCR